MDLCLNGEWGSVCDDGWGDDDAVVVCRQIAAEYGVDVYSMYACMYVLSWRSERR